MATKTPTKPISNVEFGAAVGCDHSMASRIRSGHRLPGLDLMTRISEEFGIPMSTLLKARQAGPAEIAKLLARRVPPLPKPVPAPKP